MRISLETDYAVRIVQCLANKKTRTSAAEISKITKVTEKFCLKILRKLVSKGLVKSYKGVGGGYELNKTPEDITLKEVIETIEGPIVISRCLQDDFNCEHQDDCTCYFHKVFYEASKDMANRFEKVNFSPDREKHC